MNSQNWKHYPQCWYAVALSSRLKKGSKVWGQLGGLDYVLYRSGSGGLHALDAFCPHMGAHLKGGSVAGEALCCNLHGCLVEPCGGSDAEAHTERKIGAGCRLPARAWSCAERFGLVWLHPPTEGDVPPLPFGFLNEDEYLWTHTTRCIGADWRAMICNGFDTAHMQTVHRREVVGTPKFSELPEGGIRMDYETRVLPRGGWSSALMQRLSGGRIVLGHSCAGTEILVQSQVGRLHTAAVFALLPQDMPDTPPEKRSTRAFAAVAVPKSARFARLQLWLARLLYQAFLSKDFDVVEQMRMRLDNADDAGVRAVAAFQTALPAIDGEAQS